MTKPTILRYYRELTAAGWNIDRERFLRALLPGIAYRDDPAVVEWASSCHHSPFDSTGGRIECRMRAANAAMSGHGVEALESEQFVDPYNRGFALSYVNSGDTYQLTLAYDTARGKFCLTSWGDFVEVSERTKRYTFA